MARRCSGQLLSLGLWRCGPAEVKLLLDTHILLWWIDDDERLRRRTRALIADHGNDVVVSIASLWEIAIKNQIGKLKADAPAVGRLLEDQGFMLIGFGLEHFEAIKSLPRHHARPFDYMILVQARFARASLVTQDKAMAL